MAKQSIAYFCQSCGHRETKWVGNCKQCGQWNTFEEEIVTKASKKEVVQKKKSAKNLSLAAQDVGESKFSRTKTNIFEFDRVLGGGIVEGSLVLIGGEPGIGKSTLLGNVMGKLGTGNPDKKILYVSGEESVAQVAGRMKRIGSMKPNLLLLNETNWEHIKDEVERTKPKFLVIDSIQTTCSSLLDSAPGTLSQIREVTYSILNLAKSLDISCFIVGHITKEGNIAGPKVLEHMVDAVVYFEGDQFGHYRVLRAIKNRFGNTNEVGIFEMGETGLNEVSNPSQYFLDEDLSESYGRSLTCILEGTRPMFVEIQALVVENKFGNGRRTTQGVDSNRLAMIVAIMEKYFDYSMGINDIYVNVVGGMKLVSRDSDLSILASLISSLKSKPLPPNVVFIGELGLTGEVRSVPRVKDRISEMSQLKYKTLITSAKVAKECQGKYDIEIVGIKKANELLNYL